MFTGEHKQFKPPEFAGTLCTFFIPLNNSWKRGNASLTTINPKLNVKWTQRIPKLRLQHVWLALELQCKCEERCYIRVGAAAAVRSAASVTRSWQGCMRQKERLRFWQSQSLAHNYRRHSLCLQSRMLFTTTDISHISSLCKIKTYLKN